MKKSSPVRALPMTVGVDSIGDRDVGVNQKIFDGVEGHPLTNGIVQTLDSIFMFLAPPVAAEDGAKEKQARRCQESNPVFLEKSHRLFHHSITAAAPGQAGAEDHQQDKIAALNPARCDGFVEGDGDRCGRGVAVFMQVNEDLLGGGAQSVHYRIDDAPIGLMGDNAGDFRDIQFALRQRLTGSGAHRIDGNLKDFFAVHSQEMEPVVHTFR